MRQFFLYIAQVCEALNDRAGRAVSWLAVVTVVLMCGNVALRYLFNTGAPWQVELVLACHAMAFLTAMGYTLQAGDQVRVDVLYCHLSAKAKAWVDLLGTILLLFPLCVALLLFSWGFVESSWKLQEASSEYHGLPGIFLLKTFLLIGPSLLALQGVALTVRAAETLLEAREKYG